MIKGLIGKKIGMTQIFAEDGAVIPVTVIQAGPCVVTQVKTAATDGYDAIQLGLVEKVSPKQTSKAIKGIVDKAGAAPMRHFREVAIGSEAPELGSVIKADLFAENEKVDVSGKTKGKGFQGVMKRHNFAGGPASHGSMFHRRPGSIGMCATPGKVWKGKKMPGHDGTKNVTVRNLVVVGVDTEKNLLLIKGAIPGSRNSYVVVRKKG